MHTKKANIKHTTLQNKQLKSSQDFLREDRPLSAENAVVELKKHNSVAGGKRNVEMTVKHQSQCKVGMNRANYNRIAYKQYEKSLMWKEDGERDNLQKVLKTKKKNTSILRTNSAMGLSSEEINKICTYFRYLPLSVFSSIGLKDEFLRNLNERSDFKTINPFKKANTKKNMFEMWLKLSKQAQLKAKYKHRQKYSFAYSAQLKALEYKRKEGKKRKEEEESSTESEEVKEKSRNMQVWKKSMGVIGKVFIIKGKYNDLRAALLERGWVENSDKKSNFYDLKWTSKISDINFAALCPNQMVNHFDNNSCLTSKYGLIKSVRSVVYPQSMDTDRFFPKAFDLSHLGDFENFIEVFKWIYCESLVKRAHYQHEEMSEEKVKLAMIVTERRLTSMDNILKFSLSQQFPFCSINQWNFLNDKECNLEEISKTISNSPFKGSLNGNIIEEHLMKLKVKEPQFELNGFRNIWIIKPAFLSRGRGIRCLSNLTDILDGCLGKNIQYVVQKYIENPLIINKRKFDIRVWVLVEDYNPPKIWFYNQFYLRFCLQDYNTDMLKNRYAHLTNNSVQKYNTKMETADLESSMWDRQTFQNYISASYGEDKFRILLGKMKEIVVAAILGTVDQVSARKGSFEQLGYDMMIDENLNPWLIEVNSSPAMDYSTPITRKLVKMVMEDIVKVVVDLHKKKNKSKNVGQFKLLYSGNEPFKAKHYLIDHCEEQ